MGVFKRFFNHNERELGRLRPQAEAVSQLRDRMREMSDADLAAMTSQFRRRLERGESLDDIMSESYAVVREVSRRTLNMEHFDVQIMGGIALHQGKIAEMATGEGKTLVATLPAYLNALSGGGVHVVTVNDYLARRDAEWMGEIYRFLGLSVGTIVQGMDNESRRAAYQADITYGTNNEFGFDYLRDNMVFSRDQIVQRGHAFAIVDEVDSILIDEARTPLIISGRVESESDGQLSSDTQMYAAYRDAVERVYKKQVSLVDRLVREAEELLDQGEEYQAAEKLLAAQKGAPKHRRLLDLMNERPGCPKLVRSVEADYSREKRLDELSEILFFSMDEKGHNVELRDKFHEEIAPDDPEAFMVPDIEEATREIAEVEDLSEEEKQERIKRIEDEAVERGQKTHAIRQLLKAYTLYHKDEQYIVTDDGAVVIVDEFTGRQMPGRRWGDGLHQAVEAKEKVEVRERTQTLASITLQNYFRMYDKLAGMTGTAATEEEEFGKIYGLDVVQIPTDKPLRRDQMADTIYKTERAKFGAVADEIVERHQKGQPLLVGTVSIEKSERLGDLLAERGVPHEILNARHHQREAEIVAQAGRKGAVTIATNMAGRGTDILLGGNPEFMALREMRKRGLDPEIISRATDYVPRGHEDKDVSEARETFQELLESFRKVTQEEHDQVVGLGGLHVIGTERHEARRIDNQLRGRAGRQGDPGSSQFFLSLEDDLMRLFGSDIISGLMDRLGVDEHEAIDHPMVSRALETAQRRVEQRNFEIRKNLLEYDDVMNEQRKTIYQERRRIMEGADLRDTIVGIVGELVEQTVEEHCSDRQDPDEWDVQGLVKYMERQFLPPGSLDPVEIQRSDPQEIHQDLQERAMSRYQERERELGPDVMRELERHLMLRIIDQHWMQHLAAMDDLREGISLRAYGQRDPLQEYKFEAHGMFHQVFGEIKSDAVRYVFKVQARRAPSKGQARMREVSEHHGDVRWAGATEPRGRERSEEEPEKPEPVRVKKIGRNEPCPCGSGMKYKHCCGK